MAEATTVHVKNISSHTSEAQVKDFFSFCGKISNLSISKDGDAQSAAVTFEKPTAAKTALLLDNTQLGPNLVHVSSAASLEELSSPKSAGGHDEHAQSEDVPQEDKPRARIIAEYLAHGYTFSDQAIQRAIDLDKQHGYSSRFSTALSSWDQKTKASERAAAIDQKFGVSNKAGQGYRTFNSYFEKAMNTPSGQKVRDFYMNTSKQVVDVHTEARRLADMKAGKSPTEQSAAGTPGMSAAAGGMAATGANAPASHGELVEKMNMEQIPGTSNTKCTCAGESGTCPCAPGQCRCAGCGKVSMEQTKVYDHIPTLTRLKQNPEERKVSEAAQHTTSVPPTQ
ncbi:MAG: hypothetical protein Q9162_002973 [Coniocarpon cinnabarinum]